MVAQCTWCGREIHPSDKEPSVESAGLCLDCTLNFISGQPSDRRRGERRRYSAKPAVERRNVPERRRG
jgi:ribosome-binding protein aMBF1 (putative translation factor)